MKISKSIHPGAHQAIADRNAVDRRTVLAGATALGLTGALNPSLLSGVARAATPQRGGHMIFGAGHGQNSDSLAPDVVGNAMVDTLRDGALRNKLVDVDLNGNLEPELATEWEGSKNASQWTFTLRQGVEFHNGKTMDTQDVIESINLHRKEDSKSGGKSLLASLEEIKADGDKIVFKLSAGNADFPFYLTQYFFGIVPVVDGQLDTLSGVGTGPFILESFEPGLKGIARANPNYFKEGLPYFESIEILSMRDTAARTNALLTGEVHAVDNIDLKTADRINGVPNLRIESVPGGSTITMPMHADKAPFSDVNVRRAIKYALDREQMRDTIFRGHATLGNDHPVAPYSKFHNSELAQRNYDPDKARFHLKEAGLESLDITLHASDAAFSGAVDAGTLFAENAAKAGLNVTVKREPTDGYWSNVWSNVPFCYGYWNARPTPDLILSLAYTSDAAWGDTNYKNETLDKLVSAARVETDDAKRKEIYFEIQEILHNDGSTIVPLFQNFVHGVSEKVAHGELDGSAPFDGSRGPERWWFSS